MIFWQESVGKPSDRRLETAGARCAVSSWLFVCAACAHFSSIRALIIQEIDPGTWRNSDASVRLKAFTRPAVSISSMRRCPRLEIVCRPRPAPILARVSGTSAALPLSISQSLYLSSSLLSALCSLLSVSLSLSLYLSALCSLLSALCALRSLCLHPLSLSMSFSRSVFPALSPRSPSSLSLDLSFSFSLASALRSLLSAICLCLCLSVSLCSLLSALCALRSLCLRPLSLSMSFSRSVFPALTPRSPSSLSLDLSFSFSLALAHALALALALYLLTRSSLYIPISFYFSLSSQKQLGGLNHHLDVTDEVPWEGRDAAFDDECRREKKDGVHSIVWPRAQKVRGFWTVACAPKVSL